MHWQQGGERKVEKSCIASLERIPRVKGGACAFLLHFWLWGGVVSCTKLVWPILVTGLTGSGGTGLTGFGNRSGRFVPRVGTCSMGVCICAGGLLYALVVCALCFSIIFVSDVSSRCPCLWGPRLVFPQVILLFAFPLAFDRLLMFLLVVCFVFLFSLVTKCVCCQCTHQGGGGIEDHVWFEDRWMVAF
jgi:hypothetical protein